jgi:sugar phosphate isomerase/epimerase
MIRLGIFNNVFGGTYAEQAARVRAAGLECVQLVPTAEEAVTPARCREIGESFTGAGVEVAAIAGYTNLMGADREKRRKDLARFHELVRATPDFGTRYIATETGSLNPASPWEDCPENHAPQAFEELLGILSAAVAVAEGAGAVLLIEGYVNNVLATPDEARRLREAIPSPHLQFMMDPNNYFRETDTGSVREALARIFDAIGREAPVAHAKDVKFVEGRITTPRAGTGVLDYPEFIRLLRKCQPDAPLVLEHLREEEVPQTVAYMRQLLGG